MRHDVPALIYNRVKREEMLKQHIEAKVRSGLYQAKYVAVTWGDEAYL